MRTRVQRRRWLFKEYLYILQGPLFNLNIKEYFKWERPLLLPRNYNINKNLKFNPKSGLTKIHILPFYSAATFSASLQKHA